MYENGQGGLSQDYAEAVKWYRKAAELGDTGGQNDLGYMYVQGYGVPQDYVEAEKWFRKASEQGDEDAEKNLSLLKERQEALEPITDSDRKAMDAVIDLFLARIPLSGAKFTLKSRHEAQAALGHGVLAIGRKPNSECIYQMRLPNGDVLSEINFNLLSEEYETGYKRMVPGSSIIHTTITVFGEGFAVCDRFDRNKAGAMGLLEVNPKQRICWQNYNATTFVHARILIRHFKYIFSNMCEPYSYQ